MPSPSVNTASCSGTGTGLALQLVEHLAQLSERASCGGLLPMPPSACDPEPRLRLVYVAGGMGTPQLRDVVRRLRATGAASHVAVVAAPVPHARVGELHGGLDAAERAARLRDFAAGALRVLVSSNVGARGLDTAHVAHVIQAQFAGDAVAHLHRIGRTARAGAAGCATALLTRAALPLAAAIVRAEAEGRPLDEAFSRKRSFRRRTKKTAVLNDALELGLQGEVTALHARA